MQTFPALTDSHSHLWVIRGSDKANYKTEGHMRDKKSFHVGTLVFLTDP